MTRGVKKETLAEFMELDENRRKLLVKSEELKNIEMMFLLRSPN